MILTEEELERDSSRLGLTGDFQAEERTSVCDPRPFSTRLSMEIPGPPIAGAVGHIGFFLRLLSRCAADAAPLHVAPGATPKGFGPDSPQRTNDRFPASSP